MKLPLQRAHRPKSGHLARKLLPALLGFALSSASLAGEAPNYDEDTLLGGWGGTRESLSSKGMDFELGYRVDQMSVVSGGLKKGGGPISHLDLKLKADFEKAFGWDGLTGMINILDDRGGKPNANYVGSLIGVSNVEVLAATTRFFQAWLQKEWADGQFSLLAGIYPIDTEFMVIEAGGVFIQPAFGALADVALSRGPSIFNNSALGVRAKWNSASTGIYAQGAILDGIPGDPNHAVGTYVKFGKDDGAMGIMEIGFKPPAGEKKDDAEPGYGKFAAGLWTYSEKADDLVDLDSAGNPAKRKSIGWYVLGEKTVLTGSAIGDLAVFARYSQNDGDSIPLDRSLNLGVNIKGPIKSRGDDVMALGYTHGFVASKYRNVLANDGISAASYEGAWELTYRAQATKWLAIQPVLQYIQNPAAEKDRKETTILGVRIDLAL